MSNTISKVSPSKTVQLGDEFYTSPISRMKTCFVYSHTPLVLLRCLAVPAKRFSALAFAFQMVSGHDCLVATALICGSKIVSCLRGRVFI